MSFTTFSAGTFVVTGFFIIFNSIWGKDEPQILRYAITPNRSMGADVRQTTHEPILARLAALKAMSVNELKTEWQAMFDAPAPNNSRTFLESRLAYRIQELTYGGPDKQTRRLLDLLADEVEGTLTRKAQIADPRNPVVGTKLIREWDGVAHTVTVLKEGFEWGGKRYKSLSAVAREISGTRWNGYRFFGLRERKREEA
jgi:hypothetical protein